VLTREPGDSRIGPTVRQLVLDPANTGRLADRAEALLYAADRAEHVAALVRPALARGAVVVTDRYVDSSIAYQGVGRGLGVEAVAALSAFATEGLVPDLTVVLDVPVGVARGRFGDADRLEGEPAAFHERVRQAFRDLAAAAPERYAVVDASAPVDVVAAEVRSCVAAVLAVRSAGPVPTAGSGVTGRAP
jgi:dTMP kinase